MNLQQKLAAIRDAVQIDVGNRGLARDPAANLFNACPDDFANACRSLAEHPAPLLGVITGFYIPSARLGETDGPLGAVYLARTLPGLRIPVLVVSDPFCRNALQAGLWKCGRLADVPVLDLPTGWDQGDQAGIWWQMNDHDPPTHVLALERVGPGHTLKSIRAQPGANEETVKRFQADVPAKHRGRCHTMRGVDITDYMCDAGFAFDCEGVSPVTIGIGDGGNEIGMGKIPWDVIRRNIPGGGVIACQTWTDHLIVAGVSNWGAYALAAGVALVRDVVPPDDWFDLNLERDILACMVETGPLVDGVTGQRSVSIDGLPFAEYAKPLQRIAEIVRA